jgi:hypothetical protein
MLGIIAALLAILCGINLLSLALGWLVVLPPAVCLVGISLAALQQIHHAFERVAPISITIFGREIAHIDLLTALNLRGAADTVSIMVEQALLIFLLITGTLLFGGLLLVILVAALVTATYNLLAAAGISLEIDLQEVLDGPGTGEIAQKHED